MGRESEVERLRAAWTQAKAGQSPVVLLHGEAGLGKSRLLWALKEHVAREPHAWLSEFRCSPYYRHSAFYPIIKRLEQVALHFRRGDGPAEKLAKIEGFFTQYGLPLAQGVPLMAALLSVPFASSYAPLTLTPERQKQATLEILVQALLVRAAQQPVLLVIEDLHWIDASTLDLLTHLLDQGPDHPILILLTFRPEFTPPWPESSRIVSIPLLPLTPSQARTIIGQMAGSKSLPAEVVKQIVAKTDGMPLFIEELTKTVLESSLLRETEHRYELAGPLPPLAIPSTLQDSLIERLDRLSRVKEIAQLGATLGREFDDELIALVSPWDLGTLRHGLNQLVQTGLLYQRGMPPKASYQFKHALIQDAAYQSLLKSRRQSYHLRIAQVLETQFPQVLAHQPELLAHHFQEAGHIIEAISYYQHAGHRAIGRFACVEAISHFTQGLKLLQTLPRTPEHEQYELDMQIHLGPAFMAIKGWAATEVEQTCDRARQLSQKLGHSQHLFTALWGLWTNYFMRGHLVQALGTAHEVLEMATTADDRKLRIPAHHAVGYTEFYRGNFVEAQAQAEQGLALFSLETEQEIILTFQLASTLALHTFAAGSLWMQGYPEQAYHHLDTELALAQTLNHPPSYALALGTSCFFHHYARNAAWVQEKTETLLASAREEGFLLWVAVAVIYHGWSLSIQGQIEQGLNELNEGLILFRETGTAVTLPHVMVTLAEAYWVAGETEAAIQALNEGMEEASRRQEHHMEPELYRLKAEILMATAVGGTRGIDQPHTTITAPPSSRLEQAEINFQHALMLARTQQAQMLELRAAVGLSQLWEAQGKIQEAHTLLVALYDRFTEGFNTPDLQAARARIEALEQQLAGTQRLQGCS